MTYTGGKNGSGIYQRLINNMPPHEVYVEGFLGSGALLRRKRPAEVNQGFDLSEDALELCYSLMSKELRLKCELHHGSFFKYIERESFSNKHLVFCDPPYPLSTRKGGQLYEFKLTDIDHSKLLAWAVNTDAMVMITGYRCDLYDDALKDFNSIDYQSPTRAGMVTETLWMNFDAPMILHDTSYVGDNYRARGCLNRKIKRHVDKFKSMDPHERQAILEAINAIE